VDPVDRVAVVTGAASGLGRATARALAKAGARVAVLDRNLEGARRVADELGAPATPVQVDIGDRASVAAAFAEVTAAFGRVDICVNAAGIGTPGKILGKAGPLDIEIFQHVIDVNLVGTFDVMRRCAELMAANPAEGERGVIVNVSSGAALEGQKGQAAYSASKAGVIGMMLPVARDLASLGIRVVTISPGLFDTEIFAQIPPAAVEALATAVLNPSRLGDPAEFAALLLHVVENPYLNATTLSIDAGARLPHS
jgi:NAD(P)-dependent dehydrogenase (short-subunit alcohol dehydrogenase family)